MKIVNYILFTFCINIIVAQNSFAADIVVKEINEDSLNVKKQNKKAVSAYPKKSRMWAARMAYGRSGGKKKYNKRKLLIKGEYLLKVDSSKFFSNNQKDIFFRYVNFTPQFVIDEKQFKKQKNIVNELLGNFINGTGPENVIFPHNGIFANKLKKSVMVKDIIKEWKANNKKDGIYNWGINAKREIQIDLKSGFISLEHFIGSAAIKITTLNNNEILVEIFNVTSITSADINKVIFNKAPLNSVLRNNARKEPVYSNTSQYFSFTIAP